MAFLRQRHGARAGVSPRGARGPQDPRVAATVNWLRSNDNLDEHPGGMGKQGLYFDYHTLARALSMYGEEPLKRADKPAADWRRELIEKLVSLQRTDPQTGLKYWVNDEGRWMENDPGARHRLQRPGARNAREAAA